MTNEREKSEAIEQLRQFFKPGDTLYCIIRSVARSGMSRRMDYFAMVDNELRWITPFMVRAGIPDESWNSWRKRSDYDGARIDGCGMDMCFESAYRLGCALWPKGTPQPHGRRNGEPDTAGGYAIKHRVL